MKSLMQQITERLLKMSEEMNTDALIQRNPDRVNAEYVGCASQVSKNAVEVTNYKTQKTEIVTSMEEFEDMF